MKRIKILGYGEFFQNILKSGLLDDLDLVKVLVDNPEQLKFDEMKIDENSVFKAKVDDMSLETAYSHQGEQTSEESVLKKTSKAPAIFDTDVLFLVCEIGNDPCTWHIPTLASIATNQGIFCIVLAHTSLPDHLMGEYTMFWISKLEENSDMFVFLPFNMLSGAIPYYSVTESYQLSVEILARVIRDLSNLIQYQGFMKKNSFLDDDEILEIIRESTFAKVGFGVARWDEDYSVSVENALKCPLLDFDLKEVRMALVTITGDLDLYEVERMLLIVAEKSNHETDVLWEIFPDQGNDNIETLIVALKGEIPGMGLMKWVEETL